MFAAALALAKTIHCCVTLEFTWLTVNCWLWKCASLWAVSLRDFQRRFNYVCGLFVGNPAFAHNAFRHGLAESKVKLWDAWKQMRHNIRQQRTILIFTTEPEFHLFIVFFICFVTWYCRFCQTMFLVLILFNIFNFILGWGFVCQSIF